MKKILLTSVDIENTIVISDDDSQIEVRHRRPNAFVLIDKGRVIRCFESVNMSRLISEQKCSISNAVLSERITTIGESLERFDELFIEFTNKEGFVISASGRIHRITAFHAAFPGAALVYAPQSVWKIPNYRIPLKMILTGRLIDRINELSAEGVQIELINLLNDKYSKMHSGSNSTEIQVEVDNHHLKCLVLDFESVRLFDLNV